ncbi:MAG: hypothetical protein O3A99_09950 [Proteobacteria bacterium]|nr:hypothetical protein [Pseudomonadota bacterium]
MEEVNVRWRKAIGGQGLVASCGTVSDATKNFECGCLKTKNTQRHTFGERT